MTEETAGGLKGRDWGWPDAPRYPTPLGRMNVMTDDPARWAGLRDDGPLVQPVSSANGAPSLSPGQRPGDDRGNDRRPERSRLGVAGHAPVSHPVGAHERDDR